MSESLNNEFIADPRAFIEKYPIGIQIESQLRANDYAGSLVLRSGVLAFSFIEGMNGKIELCLQDEDLSLPEPKNSTPLKQKFINTFKKQRNSTIRGYWLPWKSLTAASIQLDNEAPYFFTSALNGCAVYRDDSNPPKVSHVAGDGINSGTKEGSIWRDKQAIKEGMNTDRRYSGLRDYNTFGFVIGYIKDKNWELVGQSIDLVEGDMWVVLDTKVI